MSSSESSTCIYACRIVACPFITLTNYHFRFAAVFTVPLLREQWASITLFFHTPSILGIWHFASELSIKFIALHLSIPPTLSAFTRKQCLLNRKYRVIFNMHTACIHTTNNICKWIVDSECSAKQAKENCIWAGRTRSVFCTRNNAM